MISREKLESRLAINPHALDDELVSQPELFYHAAQQHVRSGSMRDEAKDQLKQVDAKLFIHFKAELERSTETLVISHIEQHRDHISAREVYLKMCERTEEWDALKSAFIQRSFMLKDLAALFVADYYTTSSVSGGDAREVADRAGRSAMKKKRKKLSSV